MYQKIKMRKFLRHAVCWLLCLLTLGSSCYAEAPAESELYAQAAVLMDAESGRVLYAKNGELVLPMASTTKIMTCIITLENADLSETVDISSYASSMPKVKLYVSQGETYVLRDLLYSLMLESHNDAAVAIAEHVGQKLLTAELQQKSVSEFTAEESRQAVAAFAGLMNEKAKELGCENTWFITPNGLDATETFHLENGESYERQHSTTATDLASIMSYCITDSPQRDSFLEITRTQSHSFSIANGRSFTASNHNAFLGMMDGALSGKTGFTNKAGYCYVGALQQDGRTYVVALLACGWPNNKSYKWSDTRKLMEYGLETYTYRSFEEAAYAEENLQPIPVLEGQTEVIGLSANVPVKILEREQTGSGMDMADGQTIPGLLMRQDEEIEVTCQEKTFLEAPVTAGQVVGVIEYRVDGKLYKQEHIVVAEDVPRIDFEWCLRMVWKQFQQL